MRACLVLGGTGFIGSHIVRALIDDGWHVKILTRRIPTDQKLADPNITLIEGDFEHSSVISDALDGCCACVHSVAATTPESANHDPIFDVQANIIPTIKLMSILAARKIERLVFISSGGTVYGPAQYLPIDEDHPTNPFISYAVTKLAIEQFLEVYRVERHLNPLILRVSNPFGECQRVESKVGAAAAFMDNIIHDHPITIWGDGSTVRDYVYVGDVARAVALGLHYTGQLKVFNVGSGVGRSLNELIAEIETVVGKKATVHFTKPRLIDIPANVLDISRAKTELHWEPIVPFNDGLKRLHKWFSTVNAERQNATGESPDYDG
jgi:UDP-glucose 4-epimerase